MGEDGSVVVAGLTHGNWGAANLGSGDFAAFKLDANGTLLWKWQVNLAAVYRSRYMRVDGPAKLLERAGT